MSLAVKDAPITFYSHSLPYVWDNATNVPHLQSFTAEAGLPEFTVFPGYSGPLSGDWTFTTDADYQITSETFTSRPFTPVNAGTYDVIAVKLRNDGVPVSGQTDQTVTVRIRVKHNGAWEQSTTRTVNFGPTPLRRWESVSKLVTVAAGDIVEVYVTAPSGYKYPQGLEKLPVMAFDTTGSTGRVGCASTDEGHLAGFFATPGTLATVEPNPISGGGVVAGANKPGPRPVTYVLLFQGPGREAIGNRIAELNRILASGDVAVDNHGMGYTLGGFLAAPLAVEWLGTQRPVAKVSFTLTFTDWRVWADDWQSPVFLGALIGNAATAISTWPVVSGPASLAGGTGVAAANPTANLTVMTSGRTAEFKGAPAPIIVGDTAQRLNISMTGYNPQTGLVKQVAAARFVPSQTTHKGPFILDLERGLVFNRYRVFDAGSMLMTSGDWRMPVGASEYTLTVRCPAGFAVKLYAKWWACRD